MINPEDMTFMQRTYFICALGVALAAKQRNKKLLKIFGAHGTACMHGCVEEAKVNNIPEEDIIEFIQLSPGVANRMSDYTEEDNEYLGQIIKEELSEIIDVDEFFKKDKNEVIMSEEDFNRFMNDFKKEDNS